ncbi:MAG: type II CRISPR-associated endonuclease Cas1 [Planctomycetes bacterium]|nr:type II CRISPR-associated endonuclease Cas1 [Planctomycetota bacterium]
MIERIVDISERPARLSVRHGVLVVEQTDSDPATIPLAEVAALVVSNPRVRYSHAVLSGLAAQGGLFITCDEKHLPVAMLLPLQNHYVQVERFACQAGASRPLKKRLWQQIVRAKIRAQAAVLLELRGHNAGLPALVRRVRSGDPENVEAQAARRYWPALFDDPAFRRRAGAEDHNRHLNYGYAVLRAMVARALCACGLHPSLGLHHHNRYDTFCLADDLMEPFRPLVDRAVARLVDESDADLVMGKETKASLLEALTARLELGGEYRTLFDVVAKTASSLAGVYEGKARKLKLPEW